MKRKIVNSKKGFSKRILMYDRKTGKKFKVLIRSLQNKLPMLSRKISLAQDSR